MLKYWQAGACGIGACGAVLAGRGPAVWASWRLQGIFVAKIAILCVIILKIPEIFGSMADFYYLCIHYGQKQ